ERALQFGEEAAGVLACDLEAAGHRLDCCCAECGLHACELQLLARVIEPVRDIVGAHPLPDVAGKERDEHGRRDDEPEPRALSHDPPSAAIVSAIRSMAARTAPAGLPDPLVMMLNSSSRPSSATR